MRNPRPLRIALTTCDNIYDPGGVSTSITRIARGLSTYYNAHVDILMLNSDQHAGFNPHGKNGIIQLDQRIDNVTVYNIEPWTGGTSEAQHRVDMHYALLELARERQYDLMQAFYASITGFPTVYAAHELNIPSIVRCARGLPFLNGRGSAYLLRVFYVEEWVLGVAVKIARRVAIKHGIV